MALAVGVELFVSFVSSAFVESDEHPARAGPAAITHMPTIQPTTFLFDLVIPICSRFLSGSSSSGVPGTHGARMARPPGDGGEAQPPGTPAMG
ncbi:hypothetical protein [Streptomyces javensis]|uniref:Uncharacterized protein n=1 Tax=Streptomyces javensis TaxID=114698 RepID=A0ABS0R417_9ACTN|nr:hypothetical protein [Streptomyces javensis]MBI0312123.1 hypothetical protein [Streptomyces javensis]